MRKRLLLTTLGLAVLGAVILTTFLLRSKDTASCAAYPPLEQVGKTIAKQNVLVSKIESLNGLPGDEWVIAGTVEGCPGKGIVSIYTASSQRQAEIRRLLGPTFDGLPYRLFDA